MHKLIILQSIRLIHQYPLSFRHRAAMYFELTDYLKSPNAKKLFVMYLSLISSSPSVKKNYLSLLFSIFALKHSSSYFCFSAVSPATVQIYSFLLLLNFFAIYSPFFRQNSIKCSSESKRSHSAVFLTSIFFLFSKKFKNLLLIS